MRTIKTDRFRSTSSEFDVVDLVRDYLGDWHPEELARLPIDCRPGKLRDADDLNVLALNLTRASIAFDVEPERLRTIDEMDAFMTEACYRLAEIERRLPDYSPNFSQATH